MLENYPIWTAPAKLNLFLHITKQRKDGYHNLQTIFQILDYSDELQFIPREDNQFIVKYQFDGINEKDDLILKAANTLYEYIVENNLTVKGTHYGVNIYLKKRLPMGGGLGGGSSDAATTLKALNQLWNTHISRDILMKIGLDIGADVPVFVLGKNSWAEGIGDVLYPYKTAERFFVVLNPGINISTAKLFTHKKLKKNYLPISNYQFENTENAFEKIVREEYPKIEEAFNFLSQFSTPRLTGTGACVFISVNTENECLSILKHLPDSLDGFYAKSKNS